MFKLHDKTRRLLTLLVFLLLGPALLFAVVTKSCSRHSVRTVAGWEALLTDTLGKRVEIESVRFPAPGVVRFSQMRVIDPETNEVFLQIPQWELIERFGEMPHSIDPSWMSQANEEDGVVSLQEETPTKFLDDVRTRTPYKRGLFASFGFACSNLFGKQPRYLHCEIPKISCYDTAFPQAKDTLFALATKQPEKKASRSQTGVDLKPMVLFVGGVDVFCTDGKSGYPMLPTWETTDNSLQQSQTPKPDCMTIANACFEFRPAEEEATFLAVFQQADQPSDTKPFQLAVSHWRHPVALTHVQFMSGDNEVPNRILTGIDPFFAAFGQQSRFNGNIIAEKSVNPQKNRTRSLELTQSAFFNVTLDSLLGKSLSFRLDGTADKIMLDSVRFYGESKDTNTLRLEHAKGRMYSAKGLVAWPGFRRLVEGTNLQISPENASPPDTDIYFRNGTFAFQIDHRGIQLYAASDQSQQRLPLLVIDNHCVIFLPNQGDVIPYVDLFASLAQPNTQQIPLMSETQYLISILPIDVTAINAQFQQIQQQTWLTEAVSETSESRYSSIYPIGMPQQQDLQPPSANRGDVPTMLPVPPMPVPSLTQDAQTEQYHLQYQQQPQQQLASVTGSWQSDSSAMPRRQFGDDSYTPIQRPDESQFGGQQESFRQTTTSSTTTPPALQPMQQPTQSPFMQLQTPPPDGTPYGGNSQQLMAVQRSPERVLIPPLSGGNSSRVQTDFALATPSHLNNEMPALLDSNQQTQVASAPQPLYYDNTPASMPFTTPPDVQFSP